VLKDQVVKEWMGAKGDALNVSADDTATQVHLENFFAAIRTGVKLNQPIDEGAKSVLLCHLGNIAQKTGRKLRIDPKTGHIVGDEAATGLWGREYAAGWAPVA